jgi:hypothetical protein
MLETLEGYVEAGATFLDDTVPGWAQRVPHDERLDMKSYDRCVLGHLHGYYHEECDRLFEDGQGLSGIVLTPFRSGSLPADGSWQVLNHLWRKAILARLQ